MARFDLSQYATVEERLRAFWSDPISQDARIVTINHSVDDKNFIMEARIYLTAGEQDAGLPKVTGWANEVNSDQFALERCETSAIGRCLANWLWTGSKKLDGAPRPSRQEMEKVQRSDKNWRELADTLTDVEKLRELWANAKAGRAIEADLDYIKERANALSNSGSIGGGATGGLPGLFEAEANSRSGGSIDPKPKASKGK